MAKRKKSPAADRPLTANQQKFVDAYSGNATEAARIAGYSHPEVAGCRLLKNAKIASAIRERQVKEAEPHIATRQDRQKFWTEIMHGRLADAEPDLRDRLKASELLGKSECDFSEKIISNINLDANLDLSPELKELARGILGQ
jgi:phage terminase small subunit